MGFADRSEIILGRDAIEKLGMAKVAVFGLGGVGGHCLEALVRAGIGSFLLVDNDIFEESNLNRQLLAVCSNLGESKTEAAKKRIMDINPKAEVLTRQIFYTEKTKDEFDFSGFDYIVDAIDTVSGKVALVTGAKTFGVPVISAMGAGNKLDATAFKVADIYSTKVCPLAKAMRNQLKQRGVDSLKVVYSEELPVNNARPPGSVSFVPGVMGMIMAGEVIKDILAGYCN